MVGRSSWIWGSLNLRLLISASQENPTKMMKEVKQTAVCKATIEHVMAWHGLTSSKSFWLPSHWPQHQTPDDINERLVIEASPSSAHRIWETPCYCKHVISARFHAAATWNRSSHATTCHICTQSCLTTGQETQQNQHQKMIIKSLFDDYSNNHNFIISWKNWLPVLSYRQAKMCFSWHP